MYITTESRMINSVFIRTFLRLGKRHSLLEKREDAIVRNDRLSYTGRGKTVESATRLITCCRSVGGFLHTPPFSFENAARLRVYSARPRFMWWSLNPVPD
jgi:hypothetical protein